MRSAQTFRGRIQRKRIRGYAGLLKQGETETRTERKRNRESEEEGDEKGGRVSPLLTGQTVKKSDAGKFFLGVAG